jgi:hypothetical protein
MAQHGRLLKERQADPVVMVIPHSQMFSPRSFAHEATRRCVRAMYYHCGVPLQAVSEYTMADHSVNAKLIIVPAPRVLTQKCWEALLAAAERGATVVISGAVNAEATEPVSQTEAITIGAREYLIRYDGEKIQRIEKTISGSSRPQIRVHGAGRFISSSLPIELGDSMAALSAFYKLALAQARVAPVFTASPHTPAVLVLPSVFRDVVLYTFVSETDRDTRMQVTHLETKRSFPVTVRAERTAMVLIDRKNGRVLAKT